MWVDLYVPRDREEAPPGKYTIMLEYVTHTQTIEVTVEAEAEGGINIVYLPLVQKNH